MQQNMSTKNLKNMNGLIGSIKQTWQYDMTKTDDNTLTASSPLHKLDALTTGHTNIHGLHLCKYGIIMLLKHVDMMLK